VFSGLRNETPPDGAHFYDFDGKSFKFIRSVPAPAPKTAAGEVSADHAAESQTSCGSLPDPTQRLTCYDRVGPQSESPPSEPTTAPFDHGFHFSENEFMRRFRKRGEEKGLAPVLRKETQNDEVRSHIYEVGERNMLFTFEYKINQRVRDFVVVLAATDMTNIALGLLTLTTALDTVTPDLSSDERGDIIAPMIKAVSEEKGTYRRDMKTYTLQCVPVSGIYCSFTPK
jgi:hypothetical protein